VDEQTFVPSREDLASFRFLNYTLPRSVPTQPHSEGRLSDKRPLQPVASLRLGSPFQYRPRDCPPSSLLPPPSLEPSAQVEDPMNFGDSLNNQYHTEGLGGQLDPHSLSLQLSQPVLLPPLLSLGASSFIPVESESATAISSQPFDFGLRQIDVQQSAYLPPGSLTFFHVQPASEGYGTHATHVELQTNHTLYGDPEHPGSVCAPNIDTLAGGSLVSHDPRSLRPAELTDLAR
jgi:hypothetical protein